MPRLGVWSEWESCWAAPQGGRGPAGGFLEEAGGVPQAAQDMRTRGAVGCGSSDPRLSPLTSLQLLSAEARQPASGPGVKLAGWA